MKLKLKLPRLIGKTTKFSLRLRTRQGLIAALSVLVLVSAIMAVIKFVQPSTMTKNKAVYKYQQSAQVDYRVFIEPNPFFDEDSLGMGQGYLTPITDYIETFLMYRFDGEGPAKINGHYQVTAAVTSYILKDSEKGARRIKVKVWEKVYPLLPQTSFSGTNGTAAVNEEVRLDLREYVDFAERVQDEYQNSTDLVELSVKYDITASAETARGKNIDTICPTIIIPIEGNSYTVDGVLQDSKEGSIVVQETVPVPGLKAARVCYSLAVIILALALYLVVKKTAVRIEDPLENELNRIIKKYGNRIVAATTSIPHYQKRNLTVGQFEDLLKVADELAQPILYETIADRVHSFYVITETMSYNYTLEPGLFEQPTDADANSEPEPV